MNVFLLTAHPEPRSLNGSLSRFIVDHLESQGHQVQVSDLYAMQWKASLDRDDFQPADALDADGHFNPSTASGHALQRGTQPDDIAAEQAKLLWAGAVIVLFPLWWYSMPAVMKGWFDRVYAYGFAYGVGEHSDHRWGERFGEGTLAGKRAMLVVTTGGWGSHYGPRGINGPIDDLLFPIHHGMLYYPGMSVLPPYVVHRTSKVDDARYALIQAELGQRLNALWHTEPIAYRAQNGGDYEIPALTLRDDVVPDLTGFAAHVTPATSGTVTGT
jgi:NAD(P)H dehydrogenase (quinone)